MLSKERKAFIEGLLKKSRGLAFAQNFFTIDINLWGGKQGDLFSGCIIGVGVMVFYIKVEIGIPFKGVF